jgi:hypothetical protein
MTTDTNTSFFMNPQPAGFGICTAADELLHRELNRTLTDPALTETQFFGFNVPEAGVHSVCYLWDRPNLRLMTGGVWTWQGVKPSALASEMFDMRQFMDDGPLQAADLDRFELPNGYHVEILEPLRKMRIGYEDAARDNALDITYTAVMPPAVLPSGRHFDQAMRAEGTVRLRGQQHRVDGYTVRDRSWGENRTEDPRTAPPLHWITGAFDDDFAFHLMGIEHPSSDPVWKAVYPVDDRTADAMNRGWIWRDGELVALATGSVTTRWSEATGYPTAHRLTLTDTAGRRYVIDGEITAANNWSTWSNVYFAIGLTRWEYDGRVGWGDSQTAAWTDFVHARAARVGR